MDLQYLLIIFISLFISLEIFYVKKRLEHSIRTEFDKKIELFRQDFQREITSLQAIYTYKHLAIKSSFENTANLNEKFWEAYWNHQLLWTYDEMSANERSASLKVIEDFRQYLFSHQIFFDPEVYDMTMNATTRMLALSRFRAANRQPVEVKTGKDGEYEEYISNALSNVVRLIRQKFELPAIPENLRVPPKNNEIKSQEIKIPKRRAVNNQK